MPGGVGGARARLTAPYPDTELTLMGYSGQVRHSNCMQSHHSNLRGNPPGKIDGNGILRRMAPPMIDLTNPSHVIAEIFDDDKWIKDEFAKQLSAELLKFSETLADSFKRFPKLDKMSADGDEQAAFVAGFIFGVFDDLVVSSKLLVSGKMVASGNLMRQAIEGIAVAILCSSRRPVFVSKGKGKGKATMKVDYWRKVKAQDPIAFAHQSIGQLALNCDLLGVSRTAVDKLRAACRKYHLFSHPSLLGMASRMSMGEPGPIYIGGNFDEAKLPAYRTEISERVGLCGVLPTLIDGLIFRLEANDQ
jgi:hypothetical protein